MHAHLNRNPTHEMKLEPFDEREAEVRRLRQVIVHLTKASAIGTTAAMLVHELAQPITAASNYLAAAQRLLAGGKPAAGEGALQALRFAQECLLRTADVMENVKATAASKAFRPRPVDLRVVVEDLVRLYGTGWDFPVKVRIAPAAGRVMGDPVQLAQVISNLIRNAADATAGQTVRSLHLIARVTDENMVEVRVKDNGPGIPADLKDRLFSPFSSTKADGLGVGLSICRTIIERHGGRIWAENPPLGTELCFTVPPAS